jgi:urease accessory protein
MTVPSRPEHSEIEISLVNDTSQLTTSRIFKPLKIFPLYSGQVCHIVFSNYGGGFVEGDQVLVNICLAANTQSVFSNQANTRIYKSDGHVASRHQLSGTLGAGAFAVYLGDPVIAHKGSVFEQVSHWKIERDAVLLIVDWFEAGRLLNDERFAFTSFVTEMKIDMAGTTLVWDKFKMDPENSNYNSPGAFLDHSCYLNIFLIGDDRLTKVNLLEQQLMALSEKYFHEESPQLIQQAGIMGTAVKISDHVLLIRCAARSHEMVASFVKELAKVLEDENLLGFNPIERKF